MKRTLITMLAAMFAASGVSALTITLDTDSASYGVGSLITVTATVVASGSETVGAFGAIAYEASWDPTVAHVDNAGVLTSQGNGHQVVTIGPSAGLAGMSYNGNAGNMAGNINPACNTNGYSCQFLTQTNGTFGVVTLDAQTLVATLVLRADAQGALNFGDFAYLDPTGGSLVKTANYTSAQVVPEPTTAALLGLGLLGLGVVGRRR